jgi:hypothetical protein
LDLVGGFNPLVVFLVGIIIPFPCLKTQKHGTTSQSSFSIVSASKKEKLQIETPMTDVDQNLLKLHKLTQLPAPGTQENGCSCCAAAANVWSQKYPKNDFPSTDF